MNFLLRVHVGWIGTLVAVTAVTGCGGSQLGAGTTCDKFRSLSGDNQNTAIAAMLQSKGQSVTQDEIDIARGSAAAFCVTVPGDQSIDGIYGHGDSSAGGTGANSNSNSFQGNQPGTHETSPEPDATAQSDLLALAQGMEDCASDDGGSYIDCTTDRVASTVDITLNFIHREPLTTEWGEIGIARLAPDGFSLTAESLSGNTFGYNRSAGASPFRWCKNAEDWEKAPQKVAQSGCPDTGEW